MILIYDEENDKTYITANTLNDDFIKSFLRSQELPIENFKIYFIDKTSLDSELYGDLKIENAALKVYSGIYTGTHEEENRVRVGETLIYTHDLIELNYPYDESGKFDQSLWGL